MKAIDEVILQSFSTQTVKSIQEINPKIPRALLIGGQIPVRTMSGIMSLIQQTLEVGATTLNVTSRIVTQKLINEAHKRAMSIWAWTVDDELEMKKLIKMGIDGITSNYPEKLIALRK
jgi:glycerophosphoryl diester phosphodiesterase